MSMRAIIAAIASVTAFIPLAAHGPGDAIVPKFTLVVGETRQLGVFAFTPSGCVARGRTRLEGITPPNGGSLTVKFDEQFQIARTNQPECLGKRTTGTALYYTAERPASDLIALNVLYPDGHSEVATFQVAIVATGGSLGSAASDHTRGGAAQSQPEGARAHVGKP